MPKLGGLEQDVMARLWSAERPRTVREVHAEIAARRDIAYTTVMTVLDRLERKGVVRRVRVGRAYEYEPVASRAQLTAELMHEALDVADDRAAALVRFVGEASAEEAAALRAALAELETAGPDVPRGGTRRATRRRPPR